MSQMPQRCRLVLVAFCAQSIDTHAMTSALDGGDVASVILGQGEASSESFQHWCTLLVPIIQSADAAAIIIDDTQIAGRVKADGVHVMLGKQTLFETIAKHRPRMIVGTSTPLSRHDALELGEEEPDYLFIGALHAQIKDANPEALELAQWWSSMIEIPCIVMAGERDESIIAACQTGAEFVALSSGVFGASEPPSIRVARINTLIENHSPFFVPAHDDA